MVARHTISTCISAQILIAIVLTIFACQSSGSAVEERSSNPPPNILLIMADDLGYHGLSCYGSEKVHTPNLDKLAANGLRFTDFHSNGLVCSPTRAALMTGKYQQRTGIEGVITAAGHRDVGLGLEEVTMAEALKENGYQTGIFGKWHLGYDPRFFPHQQGFDEFIGFVSGNIDYHSHIDQTGVYDWWQKSDSIFEKGYSTDLITEHAIEFIEKNKNKAFFLYVAHEAPHYPYQNRTDEAIRTVGGKFPTQGRREDEDQAYVEMTEIMDEGVGKIMERLQELKLEDNTLVVFISDNGGPSKINGVNFPLKGGKASVWEGGHRVPAIINWKGKIQAREVKDVATTIDLMPFFLSLAGGKEKYQGQLDGVDISDLILNNEPLPERAVFWRAGNQKAVRRGDWKYVSLNAEEEFLFNLANDISEENNLIEQYPEKALAFRRLLADWEAEVGDLNYTSKRN